MISCNHENCGWEKRIWIPSRERLTYEAILHPWCKHCGVIKNISDDQPKKLGYWMNILSRTADHFSLKQVQKRLIAQDLNSHECFDDLYGITGSTQKEVFIKTMIKYCGLRINTNTIDSFIY